MCVGFLRMDSSLFVSRFIIGSTQAPFGTEGLVYASCKGGSVCRFPVVSLRLPNRDRSSFLQGLSGMVRI